MKKLFVFIGVLLLGLIIYSLINKKVTDHQLIDMNHSNEIKNEIIVKSDQNISLSSTQRERTLEKKKSIEKIKVDSSEELVMEQEEIEEMMEQEKYMQELFEPKSEELTPEEIQKMIEEQESLMEEYNE